MEVTIRSTKRLGGIPLIVFGFVFATFGAFFTKEIGKDLLSEHKAKEWVQTPCAITSIEISDDRNEDEPFTLRCHYRYIWDGETYYGNRYRLKDYRDDSYENLYKKKIDLESHTNSFCYVNPENPTESYLTKSSDFSYLIILFPIPFVLIGLGIAYFGLKTVFGKQNPISASTTSEKKGNFLLIPFFSIFAIAGTCILIFLTLPSIQKYVSAKSWIPIECKIVWSEIRTNSDSDGTTYSLDIFYQYEYQGQIYHSNSYDFFDVSSSGYQAKQNIINRYPENSVRRCFINPHKPWEAVLLKDLNATAFFWLFPIPFMLIGYIGVIYSIRNLLKKESPSQSASSETIPQSSFTRTQKKPHKKTAISSPKVTIDEPITFTPNKKRIFKLLGIIAIALFWNGIVSIFLSQAIQSWKYNNPDWILTIFMIPFVCIGIGLIIGIGYQFLQLFNPAPRITVYPGHLQMGKPFMMQWQVKNPGKMNSLTIHLVGKEKATYRAGTNTRTDTNIFTEILLHHSESRDDIKRGEATSEIPMDGVVPSWKASNNEILWELRVIGSISKWPDINDEYKITVLPTDI
jgi:hypothetical protein